MVNINTKLSFANTTKVSRYKSIKKDNKYYVALTIQICMCLQILKYHVINIKLLTVALFWIVQNPQNPKILLGVYGNFCRLKKLYFMIPYNKRF